MNLCIEMLANSWNSEELSEWGLEVPIDGEDNSDKIKNEEIIPYKKGNYIQLYTKIIWLSVNNYLSLQ